MARWRASAAVLGLVLGCGDVEPRPPDPPELAPLHERPAVALCVPLADLQAEPPPLISMTGCFAEQTLSADAIPYTVRSPLWSDAAVKDRYLVLPPATRVHVEDDSAWSFPLGAVLIKNFSVELAGGLTLIETRFMVHDGPAHWRFFTYRWRADGSDAELLDALVSVDLELADGSSLRYDFPDVEGCDACHGQLALGPRTEQLDLEVAYAGDVQNQLDALARLDVFDRELDDRPEPLPMPHDETRPLEQRARSYLHANCAHCHRPGGWAPQAMNLDLRMTTPLSQTHACDRVQISPVGPLDRRITAGQPERSAIYTRTQRLDEGRMAPIGSHRVDPLVEVTVGAWIEQLGECP
jgi:hypothetical protein